MTEKILDKLIPSLAEWLGDGARAEGFEMWVKESVWAEDQIEDPRERAMIRIMRTLSIALVEIGRREDEQHGRSWSETVPLIARCAGAMVMTSCMAGIDQSNAINLTRLAKILSEEMRHGARLVHKAALEKIA